MSGHRPEGKISGEVPAAAGRLRSAGAAERVLKNSGSRSSPGEVVTIGQ